MIKPHAVDAPTARHQPSSSGHRYPNVQHPHTMRDISRAVLYKLDLIMRFRNGAIYRHGSTASASCFITILSLFPPNPLCPTPFAALYLSFPLTGLASISSGITVAKFRMDCPHRVSGWLVIVHTRATYE